MSVAPLLSRSTSAGVGGWTLRTTSALARTSASRWAPWSTYAPSRKPAAAPAPRWTVTSAPALAILGTRSGTSATRRSPDAVSFGTATITGPRSSAGASHRALHEILDPRLDPREEARHHRAHAHPRVALHVARVDQGAGRPAGPDDLADRAVDGLLDVGMGHVADVAHRGRQVARRHEEDVDMVDLDDLVELADGADVLDQDDEQALVVGD